jgi:hypothetical protein
LDVHGVAGLVAWPKIEVDVLVDGLAVEYAQREIRVFAQLENLDTLFRSVAVLFVSCSFFIFIN